MEGFWSFIWVGCADQCAGQFFMCMKNLRFRFIKKYQNGSNISFTYKWNHDSMIAKEGGRM